VPSLVFANDLPRIPNKDGDIFYNKSGFFFFFFS